MSNQLATIPTNLPANITSLFAQLGYLNADAAAGIGQGMYPLIKTSGTRFVLVKDGEETIAKTLELKVIVLRAKAGFEKRYFAGKYDPNSTEAKAPDCFSLDGIRPDTGCANPQNTACAGCPQNAFGSGKDANGLPGKGKACSDRKLLAVLYPNPDTKALEVYGLSLPPASLKGWGAYVHQLTANNIPMPACFTNIGFDAKSTFPVLSFSFGGILGDKELAQVLPMIESQEVKDIIESKAPAVSPVAPALAPPAPAPAPASNGFGFETPAPAPEKPKVVRKKAETPAPAAVPEPAPVVEAAPAADDDDDLSDDDLSALLGIKLA